MAAVEPHPAGFDRLARFYRPLEYLAFGRDLERARNCFVDELRSCRNILVLGDGDGRFLARLVEAAPGARIRCLDSSRDMLALAAARISDTEARTRVSFEQCDVLSARFEPAAYDAVAMLFFLDCLTPQQVEAMESAIRPSLVEGARWLFADFVLPPRGFLRWRARAWLGVLYPFFGWTTALAVRSLPPSEEILMRGGFRRVAFRDFQGGFVRSALFELSSGPDPSRAQAGRSIRYI
jgi:ubiquinone/menaquinone biosynthesis C-methylase UbiE